MLSGPRLFLPERPSSPFPTEAGEGKTLSGRLCAREKQQEEKPGMFSAQPLISLPLSSLVSLRLLLLSVSTSISDFDPGPH